MGKKVELLAPAGNYVKYLAHNKKKNILKG